MVSGIQSDVETLPHAVVRRPCHVVSAEIAVAMAAQIENPADREVRGISFLQADDILGYLAEETISRVELFCCTTMHVHYYQADTSLAA